MTENIFCANLLKSINIICLTENITHAVQKHLHTNLRYYQYFLLQNIIQEFFPERKKNSAKLNLTETEEETNNSY